MQFALIAKKISRDTVIFRCRGFPVSLITAKKLFVGDKPPVANILFVSYYTNILTLHTVLTLKLPRQIIKYKRECTNKYICNYVYQYFVSFYGKP